MSEFKCLICGQTEKNCKCVLDNPRQPDMSAERDAEAWVNQVAPDIFKACERADIQYNDEMVCHLLSDGYLAGHARALEEMGAEIAALNKRISDSRLYAQDRDAAAKMYKEQLADAELKAAEYEKALETIRDKSPRCDCMDAPGIACEVLATHRRGGEGV
jgi:hypothetical protein